MGFDVPIDYIISDCNLEVVKYELNARPDVIGVADLVNGALFLLTIITELPTNILNDSERRWHSCDCY